MRAVVMDRPGQVEVREVPVPFIGPHEVLVRVRAAGICGTDVHIFRGEFVPRFPLTPGHEFSGEVEAVGDAVRGFRPGDRVAADPNVYCERCYFCKQNKQNFCENWEAIGVTLPGAFAEYVAVPDASLFPIADGMSFAQGAFTEPLSCVVYGQQRARPPLGGSVLIFGAGPIGLLHQQLAKRNGAGLVVMVDVRRDRLQQAKSLGADHVVPAGDGMEQELRAVAPRGFELVVEATGVPAVVENAIRFVQNDGTLLVFGVSPNESSIRVNPYEIYKRDLRIVGSFSLRKTFQAALELLAQRAIDVEPLIGQRIGLDEFPRALQAMARGEAPGKILVQP
ncbi:zinc-dependent alcohol dehydrogenase family protein [Carboxydochorda subterranea]|uniref:Zinc-dependent alcohol dehydrogenase family protein n=1 Tax=Carboxydichorda subterranea TaxID=3109565 RepID=A0ABZ1BX88_9FIRM|nr:zinc-dependent alcohol dehydrogenase family protein [Limnochorda sp. L945t]WRP17318.1 zinc-dependent alcohol dehydrogenase family protein [Limnochorda sp. L945t]